MTGNVYNIPLKTAVTINFLTNILQLSHVTNVHRRSTVLGKISFCLVTLIFLPVKPCIWNHLGILFKKTGFWKREEKSKPSDQTSIFKKGIKIYYRSAHIYLFLSSSSLHFEKKKRYFVSSPKQLTTSPQVSHPHRCRVLRPVGLVGRHDSQHLISHDPPGMTHHRNVTTGITIF